MSGLLYHRLVFWSPGDDPHHRCSQGICSVQGHRRGSEPYVDRVCLPAASPLCVCVRWGCHLGAESENCQVFQRWEGAGMGVDGQVQLCWEWGVDLSFWPFWDRVSLRNNSQVLLFHNSHFSSIHDCKGPFLEICLLWGDNKEMQNCSPKGYAVISCSYVESQVFCVQSWYRPFPSSHWIIMGIFFSFTLKRSC